MSPVSKVSIPTLLVALVLGIACRPRDGTDHADSAEDEGCEGMRRIMRTCYDNRPDMGPDATDAEQEKACAALGTTLASGLRSDVPREAAEMVGELCTSACDLGMGGLSWKTVEAMATEACEGA